MRIITKNEKQTFNLGKKIGQKCQGGEVFALFGELGSGKTIFTKGLAAGLGIKKIITSPTFVLMKLYRTRTSAEKNAEKRGHSASVSVKSASVRVLCHIDAYRLKSHQDLVEIGVLDWLNKKDTVTVIEWADRIKKILPKKFKKIVFNPGRNINERAIDIF